MTSLIIRSLEGVAAAAAIVLASSMPAWSKEPRVIFFGADGADMEMIEECIARGGCPNFKRLVNRSARAELRSVEGEGSSPVIWTSIATGKTRRQHGVPPLERRPKPQDRRVKAMWNIFSDAGWRVGVFGYLVTSASEPVRGVVVSAPEWQSPELEASPGVDLKTVFEGLTPEEYPKLLRRLCDEACQHYVASHPDYPWGRQTLELAGTHMAQMYARDEAVVRSAEQVLRRKDLDFAAIYVQGTDMVSHAFQRHRDPRWLDFPIDERVAFARVVLRYYERADDWLGRILSFAGPETTVLVVSDHGIVTHNMVGFTPSHRQAGLFLFSGPQAQIGSHQSMYSVDVLPLLLYLNKLPVAEDMEGFLRRRLVRSDALAELPMRFVASYESSSSSDAPAESERKLSDDDRRLLKAMGYLDTP